MSGAPDVHYSPDGRWWWDGSQWRQVPLVSQPGGGRPAAAGPPRPRSAGVPVWVIVVLVVFVTMILLGGVGLYLALRTAADRVASNPPMPAVSIPAASPGQGPTLPAISGLAVSQVTTALQQNGYRCTGPERAISTWVTSCSRSQNGLTYEVSLGGSTRTNVDLVDAALIGVSRAPTDADAAQFFTQVMGAMGQGAGAEPTAWIQQNVTSGGDTSSGGLDLHLGRTGSDYVLVVSPS